MLVPLRPRVVPLGVLQRRARVKARKIAGIRLQNYLQSGINWKAHKDVILDFWIGYKCKESGYSPYQFANMARVVDLPTEAQNRYQEWFENFDFQTTTDKAWMSFVDGTLNIFYHTGNPVIEPDDEWYIELMQSEVNARDICENQVYHGKPNLNSFFRVETNSKPEEVGGRRNGYMFTRKLSDLDPAQTKDRYWGVVFQCPETVTLEFDNDGKKDRRAINWAANAEHMTLVRVCGDGRLKIEPVFVKGKVWRADRYVPDGRVSGTPMSPKALLSYIKDNFYTMYGVWDEIDNEVKDAREQSTARLNALNVMNDEEVKVGRVIPNLNKFIDEGNVSDERREYNAEVRKAVAKREKQRQSKAREKVRNIVKAKKRADAKRLAALHVQE